MEHKQQPSDQEQLLSLDTNPPEAEVADLPPIDFISPGRFSIQKAPDFSNKQTTAIAAEFILGQEDNLQRFSDQPSARSHLLALLQQAKRSLCFYTDELEPWLYDQKVIIHACQQFLLGNHKTQLRILLRDSTKVVQDGHQLLQLARRLPSNLHIRKLNPDNSNPEGAFVIADDRGLMHLTDTLQPSGYTLYNNPGRTRQQQALFDQAWDQSLFDSNLRSMPL